MRSDNLTDRTAHSALFARAYARGQRGELLTALTGRSRRLLALNEALGEERQRSTSDETQTAVNVRSVPILQILGSEGRCTDFDRDFSPLTASNRDRWLRIVGALARGRSLPPVGLVQVGDIYFVRDGHHRISVAQALGHRTVMARVITYPVQIRVACEHSSKPRGSRWAQLARVTRGRILSFLTWTSGNRTPKPGQERRVGRRDPDPALAPVGDLPAPATA